MALREFQAYLDTPNTLSLTIEKRFVAEDMSFTLESSDTKQELLIQQRCENDLLVTYLLGSPIPISLEKDYMVMDQDRNKAELGYGKIVRSTVFEELFSYENDDLGAHYTPFATTFRLWAPISKKVYLVLNDIPYPMQKGDRGVWQVEMTGDWDKARYHFLHRVNGQWKEVHDPYALSSLANAGQSIVINKAKLHQPSPLKKTVPFSQAIIYEMSVRDFSQQKEVDFKHSGLFKGLVESPPYGGHKLGLDYLSQLGITHIQLMPLYDFGSVDEENPQAVYNWGYDPVQYNVPEGSFATDPNDPYARIHELQEVISTYHEKGIGIVMDVVYNHVYHAEEYAFERLVPGYFYRYDKHGNRTDGTFCGNDVASERSMVRNYIKQSLKQWVSLYGFDGFRFDLMGILDIQTIHEIAQELRTLNPNLCLYGEGWKMATGLSFEQLAHQYNAEQLPSIGFFNDLYRDQLKKVLLDSERLHDGEFRYTLEKLLAGSVHTHFVSPTQSVNYIECHDNATLFDYLHQEAPQWSQDQLKQAASFALQLLLISQGPLFIHSGQEAFRTKQGVENSYNSPDSINQLDWSRIIHYHDHVDFIRQLIAFRQQHPELSQADYDSIQKTCRFYWLTPNLLRYTIETSKETLCIFINFAHHDTSFEKEDKQTILFHSSALTGKEKLIPLAGQSISISTISKD